MIARGYLTLVLPLLLVIAAARLVMTPAFVSFEYHRPNFPADFYGFTREDRLTYAPYAIDYLLNGEGIDYLGDLTFPDGQPLFNARELRHMVDVKTFTQLAFGFAVIAGTLAISAAAYLRRRPAHLRAGLRDGAVLTIAIIAAITITAIFNWEFFFTGFHQLFFESGTWQFLYSDTLIRLFPEQFWFDAALTLGALTLIGAIVVLIVTWRWR